MTACPPAAASAVGWGVTVDDECEPFKSRDNFSLEDTADCGLRFLYNQSCKRVGVKPDACVLLQLPPSVREWDATVRAGHLARDSAHPGLGDVAIRSGTALGTGGTSGASTLHPALLSTSDSSLLEMRTPTCHSTMLSEFMVLDCSRTYLGNDGCAALMPILAASVFLTHLTLPHVGMLSDVGKAIALLARRHPTLSTLDLSHNTLGCSVGHMLLQATIANRNIVSMKLDHCLIIDPILQKIARVTERNAQRQRRAPSPVQAAVEIHVQ